MNKKLSLDVNQLSMGDPPYDVVNKYFFTFLQYSLHPGSQPKGTGLMGFPEYIDEDSSSVFFCCDVVDYFVHLLHDQQVLVGLGLDVAEGEMPAGQKIPLHSQHQSFILFQASPQTLSNGLPVHARVLVIICKRYLDQLLFHKPTKLTIVVPTLCDIVDHLGLIGSKNRSRRVNCEGGRVWLDDGASFAEEREQ